MTTKLMVVDDQKDFLHFIEQVIRDYCPGYHVHTCSDSTVAVAEATSLQPDLILLDVSMPGIDGFEVCRRLKNDPQTSDIPVLMLSGALMEQHHRAQGMDIGADGYICKPFVPLELVTHIRALLRAREEALVRAGYRPAGRLHKIEAVGLLAADIAHDFNNLLTAVIGNVSLVRTYDLDRTQQQEALTEAEEAALRAKDLSQQLLTFARGGEAVRAPVHLGPILRPLADRTLRAKGVKTAVHMDADLWLALADANQLVGAVECILINAREAAGSSGEVDISAKNLKVAADSPPPDPHLKPGRYIDVAVHDNGPGIPDRILPFVGKPFHTTKGAGRGLGLAIATSILRQHEGALLVHSEAGCGVTVHLYLPAIPTTQSSPATTPPREQERRSAPTRILVMDDESYIRKLLVRALHMHGFAVEDAADGEAALQLFRDARTTEHPYDLVILDLTIPQGMGAAETLRHLLTLDPGVRAILSSGYVSDPILKNYREHGFRAVVAKPYDLPELLATVERTLREE